MRKFFLTCLMFLGLGAVANAQEAAFEIDEELQSFQDGDVVALYNKSDNQYLYGTDNQNLGYNVAEEAFKPTNSGWLFKIQEAEGHYLFLLQTPAGEDYNIWGSLGYLNSQPETGWCSFILGLGDQWGADGENLALWDIEPTIGGFLLKNVGTGLYLNNNAPAKYPESEAAVWSFCTLKEAKDEEAPAKSTKGTWVSVINNGDFENSDLSSFHLAKDAVNVEGAPYKPEIVDREEGGHCAKIVSDEHVTQQWSTQLFIRANDIIPVGTKYRMKFDVRSERDDEVFVGAHGEPRKWHAGGFADNFTTTSSWNTVDFGEGEITSAHAGGDNGEGFRSVALDLNVDMEQSNTFYFDNFVFEIFKPSTAAEFHYETIEVTFPYDTNISALVNAGGKSRLLMPTDCFTVKINGKEEPISTVELASNGGFYVFLDEDLASTMMNEGDEVIVSFKNPTDAQFRIVYTEGMNNGVAVEDFILQAEYNEDINVLSSNYTEPELVSAYPEKGSFNLPNDIKEFKVVFDKNVICNKVKATLGKENLSVSPADGYAKEMTFIRTGTGNLPSGVYTLSITNVIGEKNLGEDYPVSFEYSFNVGKVEINPADQPEDIIPVSRFDECNENTIPEGFQVVFNETVRASDDSYQDGPRVRNFTKCADFSKALYFTKGYVEYGSVDGSELTLTAGIPYRVEFNSAMWKVSGKWMKFEVLDANGNTILQEMVKNSPNMEEKTDAEVAATTFSSFKFVVAENGNYKLRWTACDKDGVQGNYEVLLAKVHMYSIPATPGWEEVTQLQTALALAQETVEAATGDRYAGEAFNALDAAVKKYGDEAAGYTAPSAYHYAISDLTEKIAVLATHRSLCDAYDAFQHNALEKAETYLETKFAAADLYKQLQAAVAKYGDKVLTNDEELAAANAELDALLTLIKHTFTVGKSTIYDAWNDSKPGSGCCVLTDRLRQGAEALASLGIAEDDALIVAANNALTDDDALADNIKGRIKAELYSKLKEANNTLFEDDIDDYGETITTSYNMTVFVKNPNIYVLDKPKGVSEENIPGWTVPSSAKPGLFDAWGDRGLKEIPQDIAFSAWKTPARMEQTVTDLPAGVYSVSFGAGSWNATAEWIEGSFCYVKTSDTPAVEEGEEESLEYHFADVVNFQEQQVGPEAENNLVIEEITVTDGVLTFGVQFGKEDQPFFNMVELRITNPATSFDYGKAYQEVITGVETAQTAKVRAIELYNLNGKRVNKAGKGLVIVKKMMSDGTVKTAKVVK